MFRAIQPNVVAAATAATAATDTAAAAAATAAATILVFAMPLTTITVAFTGHIVVTVAIDLEQIRLGSGCQSSVAQHTRGAFWVPGNGLVGFASAFVPQNHFHTTFHNVFGTTGTHVCVPVFAKTRFAKNACVV